MISSFCSNKLWEPVITGVICSLGLAHYSDQSWGDSVVSGACPDCLALCITLVLLVAKHHHWQTVTRLNYFYGYSPTRNVGSIFQMMGIWCGSIILNKTDLIWNWICLFQFCFEARVDTKGGEREGGGKPLFLEQRSVVSPPSGVSTHMMRWHGGHPGYIMSLSRSCLGSEFIFVPTEETPDVSEKVWPTCRHLRIQKLNLSRSRGGEKHKRAGPNLDQDICIFSVSNRSWF